ncbi:hypothetical protein FDJ57_gp55 [Gordonia phage Sour]|uniref:Uncharacterized protein n=1 Tax=Gordonia phage Sour TaxID=2182349 RepID=A0A2U8ULE3_9CAUD|nr:hypothetical protein FDJ57_gp55 [Gordonia phage Sour]AWN04256.1 hypothetical protein PBI_SOUR_55 [Gordonia phage Sour]
MLQFATIERPSDLYEMPEGTLVTWQRIADDPTSTAVAFLHRKVEPIDDGQDSDVTLWLSPGGWEPMGLDVIEHWDTVRVLVRVPDEEDGPEPQPADGPEPPRPFEFPERTDADYRDRAMALAVEWTRETDTMRTTTLLDIATGIEGYLRGQSGSAK